MKLLFKKLLSLREDGAACFLLILDEKFTIMLDCGINHAFDLSKYRAISAELRLVQLVLISHSALQYSGAYPFLVSELGMNPKIFYTTQPIMRYSPLNIHEEMLNLRLTGYNQKVFNRIYSHFEEMNLVKPYQKKQIQLVSDETVKMEEEQTTLREPIKTLQFCCYLAGGCLGSLYWRISYGLINILYLVEYNNYSLHHIAGLDFDNLATQTTSLLITDAYPRPTTIKRADVLHQLKQALLTFYRQNYIEPNKPKTFNPQHDQKLLFACYPTQLVVEVLASLRKVVAELQDGNNIQKIGIIHLSSRFLQLVKSQSEYFSIQFKEMLQKLTDYFKQSLTLDNRINVCSVSSLKGILAASGKNLQVIFVGSENYKDTVETAQTKRIIRTMKIFDQQEEKLLRSASKLSVSKIDSKAEIQDIKMEDEGIVQAEPQSINQLNKQNFSDFTGAQLKIKNFNNKYIAINSGIPQFRMNKKEKDEEITIFGQRHHTDQSVRPQRQTIYEHNEKKKLEKFEEQLMNKKQSKIEVMNIEFNLPTEQLCSPINTTKLNVTSKSFHRTEFQSSLRVINYIKPRDIIFVNLPQQGNLLSNYQYNLSLFNDQRKIMAYDSNVKKLCYLSYNNELLEYKMNYLPEMQQKKVQRVKGTITRQGNCLHIHLDCLQDVQIVSFRLQKFFSVMNSKMSCKFLGFGIEIEGVKIYRKENLIIMEGDYSDQYFKVRQQLYNFLGL